MGALYALLALGSISATVAIIMALARAGDRAVVRDWADCSMWDDCQ